MPRKPYPEHLMLPIPDQLRLCTRCKQGLVYQPNNADPFCMKCGDSGAPGEAYLRFSVVADLLSQAFGWDVLRLADDGQVSIKLLEPPGPQNGKKGRADRRR